MSVPKLVAVERAKAEMLLLDAETKVTMLSESTGCEAAAERQFWLGVRHALAEIMPEFMPEGEGDTRTVLDLGHIPDCAARRIAFAASICVCR